MPAAGGVAPSRPTRLGRYELITRIGQGGMAEVQLALQRGPAGFEKLVVVKLVHSNLATQKAFVDMLLDEARVAALVKHPNVVDIYDLGQADGRYFIAMEYLEGEPLLAVLRAGREGNRLDPLSTGRLIADTAEGLDAAHELRSMSGDRLELVHHDISLGNIVVLYNGQVKLVDFGVAKATQSAGPRSKVQGKFSYMAPEKLRGAPGDRRSDIFSLGCVMWEALTLKRLFRGGNDTETMKQVLEMAIQPPSKVNGDVPPEYDPIVMRALDRDPNRRQRTAKEMAVEIEELLRKRGYGAKNDQIARYMQDAFRTHIDARKKLVQEVVSKGSASAEVLDAAFNDPVIASGSPAPVAASEFSLKYQRVPARQVHDEDAVPRPTASWADSSPRTTIRPPIVHPMFDEAPNSATELAPLPDMSSVVDEPPVMPRAVEAADAEATRQGTPLALRARALTDRARALTDRVLTELRGIVVDRKMRIVFAAGAGVLVLLIVILAIKSGSSKGNSAAAAGSAAAGSADEPTTDVDHDTPHATDNDLVAGAGSDVAVVEPAGSDAAGGEEIELDPTPVDRTRPERHVKQVKVEKQTKVDKPDKADKTTVVDKPVADKPPPIDVTDTVNQGLKAFVTGDTRGALVLLKQAKAAKPGYAPTYRVLGKVYKKLGDRASAKASFQRYLKLAPGAPDADQIKKELDEL